MNTNVLIGFKCPKCGNEESFKIIITILVRVYDSGLDDILGDACWDDNSYCECEGCTYHATTEHVLFKRCSCGKWNLREHSFCLCKQPL